MRAHVRDRRDPRSGRHAGPRRGASGWSRRCATAAPTGTRVRRIGPLALAHTRLAIIDVAGGDQPLDSEDGAVTAIVNGEIYNHRDAARRARGARPPLRHPLRLRGGGARLRGARARLRAPTSTASSPSRSGTSAAPARGRARRVRRQAALLVERRPPRGASPPRSGRCSRPGWSRPAVDRVALDHYLACRFVPAPRTLFDGDQQAARRPRRSWSRQDGAPRVESWREAPGEPVRRTLGDDELADQLAERFTDAVERQMMSDVPYGAFLSGGVDSAAVVAAMAARSERPPDHLHDRLPRPRRRARRARARGRERPADRHRPPRRPPWPRPTSSPSWRAAMPRLEEPCGIP